ncbi:unnamed protein product [Linum tenue]|uniref:COBRA C-terminal domain-containing protein n=1 Tax=Linum tenue TaxID=586396 RepID=A0AAV0S2N6_9ROSI|nr:unnamed protein product [Linum tenue]
MPGFFVPFALAAFLFLPICSIAQTTGGGTRATPSAAAPAPAADNCNGIFLSYRTGTGSKIAPTDPKHQPYRFESTLTVQNNGIERLKSWQVYVGFKHDEVLVSASNAILADGSSYPALVGNGTVFAGFPMTDLKTAIETAGDSTQTSVEVKMLGTQFGVKPPAIPWPANITLVNDGWACPAPSTLGGAMSVCCIRDENAKKNITVLDGDFLPRQSGDLTIAYDVTRAYDSSYWAQVTLTNHNHLGRLDNWKLSWDWMQDEFIFSMKGAYPSIVDSSPCIFGPQGEYYKQLDFSTVLNCERRPTIIDLPPTKFNDSTVGMVPFCCRNGTILPPSMDPSKSVSSFQMQVFKMPPTLNRSDISPPQNWKINGTLNPDYQCGPPVRVSPSEFVDPSGLPSNSTAVASWQVVCNITQPKGSSPRCCVSFSAFYNDSVVPCNTCACGCPNRAAQTCSATAPPVLLPPNALLVPFDNRTTMATAWANIKHRQVPNPMPCPDNCGVSINWHVNTDYNRGWSARVTLFNWAETLFPDWFVAVEMDKAAGGFEAMYSFNGTMLPNSNSTLFMQGLPGLNYLVGETDGLNPSKDPRVPGKQQSVISFTKRTTPGINVPLGDGFPTKVYFNGEECSLPSVYPTSDVSRRAPASIMSVILAALVASILMKELRW